MVFRRNIQNPIRWKPDMMNSADIEQAGLNHRPLPALCLSARDNIYVSSRSPKNLKIDTKSPEGPLHFGT